MDQNASRALIQAGQAVLGIEFGSTRIKAVLVDGQGHTLAVGTHDWENRLENGIWTYSLEDIHEGLQGCYASLKAQVQAQYGITLQKLAAAGISAMMHGYLAFDRDGTLLVPFRTWRNTMHRPMRRRSSPKLLAVPHAPAVDHRPPVPGGPQRRGACETVGSRNHPGRATSTGSSPDGSVLGVGEGSGVFPLDGDKPPVRPRSAWPSIEALFAPYNLPWKAADRAAAAAARRRGGRTAHRGRCQAAGPRGRPGARRTLLPAGGRRGHGHGGHQLRGPRHGQRVRRHVGFRHGGAGEGPCEGLPRDGHGGHPHGQARGHGPLQQLHLRPECLGGIVCGSLPSSCGLKRGRQHSLWHTVPQGAGGRQGLWQVCWPTTSTPART